MAVILKLECVLFRNPLLGFFDSRVLELHNLPASAADQVIVMGLGTRAFVVRVAACAKALRHHARLQKDRKVAINRIPGDLQPPFFEAGNEHVHIEMPALAPDPRDQLQPLARQAASPPPDKALEFFVMVDHTAGSSKRSY